MIKDVEKIKKSEDNNNCPYFKIINVFKNIIKNQEKVDEKYLSITNRVSLLSSGKNVNMIITDVNKFKSSNNSDSIGKENTNINENKIIDIKEKDYDPNLFYYNPFPNLNKPILFIAIVSFHHKKGSIVEYTYPSKDELLKNNPIISYFIENSEKTKKILSTNYFTS